MSLALSGPLIDSSTTEARRLTEADLEFTGRRNCLGILSVEFVGMDTIAAAPSEVVGTGGNSRPSGSGAVSKKAAVFFFLAKVFFFLASIFVGKMCVFQINNLIEMLLVQKALDPSIFTHDSYVATLQYYPIPLWHWIAPLFTFTSQVNTLLILGLLQRIFVFWTAGRLALSLTNGNRWAELAAWAIFSAGIQSIVGEGRVYPYYFEHSGMCIGCLMLAMAMYVEKKKKWFALWVGLAGFFNLLYGLGALLYFLASTLALKQYRESFLKWFEAAIASFVPMSPAFYYAWQVYERPKMPAHEFALINRLHFPFHYFPTSWSNWQFVDLGIAAVAMACVALWSPLRKEIRVLAGVWTGMLIFFLLLAYFGGDLMEISFLISTEPARLSDFWYTFSAIAMVSLFTMIACNARTTAGLLAGVGGVLASIAFWRYGWLDNFSIGVFGYGAIAYFVAAIVAKFLSSKPAPMVMRVVTGGAFGVIFLCECVVGYKWLKAQPGGDILQRPDGPQAAVYDWIKNNTPKDARFLTSPFAKDFRARTNRSPYFLMREASALMWDPTYGYEWLGRLHTFNLKGSDEDAKDNTRFLDHVDFNYSYVTDRNARALGYYENVQYWVIGANHPSTLPVVYEDQNFKVVSLK